MHLPDMAQDLGVGAAGLSRDMHPPPPRSGPLWVPLPSVCQGLWPGGGVWKLLPSASLRQGCLCSFSTPALNSYHVQAQVGWWMGTMPALWPGV